MMFDSSHDFVTEVYHLVEVSEFDQCELMLRDIIKNDATEKRNKFEADSFLPEFEMWKQEEKSGRGFSLAECVLDLKCGELYEKRIGFYMTGIYGLRSQVYLRADLILNIEG